jgi:replicative DNA helicase
LRGDSIAGVPTGFVDFDKALGGLHPSDMVVLAARPSMGKTSLVENIVRNAAKVGKAVGVFSLEM